MRWLGKRMSGQLTITEMAVMLTLGAIVSVGIQVPDRGIILSMLVLLCTLTFHRGLGTLGFKNSKVDDVTQGKLAVLVKEGVLQLNEMRSCNISHQQLFAQLRAAGIYDLGRVKRVYLEASGLFSIFPTGSPKPGLPVLPPQDQRMPGILSPTVLFACVNCGLVKDKTAISSICSECGHDKWTEAVS